MHLKLMLAGLLIAQFISGQQINRVYVEPVDQTASLEKARADIISELRKLKSVQVVDSPAKATAVLVTTGEIYVRGFYSLNPRSGLNPTHGRALYGGYRSGEVKDAHRN